MADKSDLKVRVKAETSDFNKGLDQSTRKIKSFQQQAGSLLGSTVARFASVTAAVSLMTKTIGDTIRVVADFQRSNSVLASVLGTTRKEIQDMTQAAVDLGRKTEFTASQVTELQTNLARLGFSKDQILAMEESALLFAQAVGADLGSAAEFTGAALRAFGLRAEDAGRLLDIMASSTSLSALSFEKLQTSIGIVAPVAHAFGMDAASTVAILGALANSGLDASSAATALRNILLDLGQVNGKIEKQVGHEITTFPQLLAELKKLQEAGVGLDVIGEMVDKRAVAAFSALFAGTEDLGNLKKGLDESAGSVKAMATEMGDNLTGAVKQLQSAWEGLQLSFSDSAGPLQRIVVTMAGLVNRVTDLKNAISALWSSIPDWARDLIVSRGPAGYLENKGWRALLGTNGKQTNAAPEKIDQSLFNEPGYNVLPTSTAGSASTEKIEKTAKAAKTAVEDMSAVLAEQAEYAALDAAAIAELERRYGILGGALDPVTQGIVAVADKQMYLKDCMEQFNEVFDENYKDWEDWQNSLMEGYLQNQLDGVADSFNRFAELSEQTVAVIQQTLITSFKELGTALGDLSNADFGSIVSTILTPLADLAITAGTIILTTGNSLSALTTALKTLSGPVAIAAGATLIAVGVAAKAGLAALSKSGGGYSSASSVASSSSASYSGDYSTRDVTVSVTGELVADGSKLVAVINNTNKKKGYTT